MNGTTPALPTDEAALARLITSQWASVKNAVRAGSPLALARALLVESDKWADYNAADDAQNAELEASVEPWRKVGENRDPLPMETRLKWLDMFGIDPDYCGGEDVDKWLEKHRGEA